MICKLGHSTSIRCTVSEVYVINTLYMQRFTENLMQVSVHGMSGKRRRETT